MCAHEYVSALEARQLSVPWDSIAAGGQVDEPMVLLLFFLRHSKSDKRVFDLGIQRQRICTCRNRTIDIKQVAESLESGGVSPSSINLVKLFNLLLWLYII